MADAHANFAYGTIATAPSPASSGTSLTLSSGAGALMPAVPFNATVWPTGVNPLNSNAEIVRVTNRSGDVLTISRAQEGTSARSILVGDQFAATITAKTLTDAELTITDGANSVESGTLRLSNANGVSVGINGSTVTFSHNGLTTAAASNHSHGNPQLNLTNLSGTTASNSAGFTLSLSAAAGGGGADGYNILAAGTQTATTAGTVLLENSNGITFGMSGSTRITASHNGLTTARASNDAVGLNTAQTNVTWTVNSAGISLNAGAYLTTAMQSNAVTLSNIRVSAGTTSNLLSALTFANSNGLSFGINASTITGSHNGLTTARASNDGIGLNTAQTNVTWTVNSSGLSFNAAGYAGTGTTFAGANISASMTLNSNGLNLSASVAAGGGGGVTPVASASNGSFSFTTLAFSNANNVTFGTSAGSIITASVAAPGAAAENNAINLLGANTAGNTTATGSTIGWSGVNLTFSGTNASQVVVSAPATSSLSATGIVRISTNGSTISIGAGRTISGMVLAPFGGLGAPMPFAQSSISLGQNSVYFYPVQIEDYLTLDHVRMPVIITHSSSGAASVQKGQTYRFGIYTRNATNNTIYTQQWSTSYTMAASHNSSVSWAVSLITAIGNSTSYNTVSASSAGVNLSASLHGPRELIMPVSTLLTPGEYWFAIAASTSSAGAGGNVLNISNLAVAYQTYNRPGLSTNATGSGFFQYMGAGTYSATTGALPGGISATQINQLGTLPILFAATGTV